MIKSDIKFTLFRIGIVTIIAIMALFLIELLLHITNVRDAEYYIYAIIAFNLVSEGNIIINRWFDRHHPWFFKVLPRITKQLLASLIWICLVGLVSFFIIPMGKIGIQLYNSAFSLAFIFGTMFVLIFDAILFIQSFILNWQASFKENEQLKLEKLKADYMVLQNQLNPHFLFNSLSVLISEIRFNPINAEKFARKMSDVYRYVLKCKDITLVSLSEELKFIEGFIFMHQIRHGEALNYSLSIPEDCMEIKIPPLTLQLLVENAIKHNSATQKSPLNIDIYCKDNQLIVCNNLQIKSVTNSTKTGLENLNGRFKLLKGRGIIIEKTATAFIVSLPLQ